MGSKGRKKKTLDSPLEVKVTNSDNEPVEGIEIQWLPLNGSLSGAINSTDAEGVAHANWTLGSSLGAQALQVKALGADKKEINGSGIIFHATAISGNPCDFTFTWPNGRALIVKKFEGVDNYTKVFGPRIDCNGTVLGNDAWVGVTFTLHSGETKALRVDFSFQPTCQGPVIDSLNSQVFTCR